MEVGSTVAARPTSTIRSSWLASGILFVAAGLAFASAALSWLELLPRPVFSADHRSIAVVVGLVLLVLAVRAAMARGPAWAFVLGATSCLALGAFAIYDQATGNRRNYAAFVEYIRHTPVARLQSPNVIARWSMSTTNRFATGLACI
jgi:hypothetical protein